MLNWLEKYSYINGWLSFGIALLGVPTIVFTLRRDLKEKSPGLNVNVSLKDVFQEPVNMPKEELKLAIKNAENGISSLKKMRNSLFLKNEEVVKYLEQSKEMYEAHLESKGGLVKLYSTISVELIPNLPTDTYAINSIGFEYETMTKFERILSFLKIITKKAGWALLPEDFQKQFAQKQTNQLNPIVVNYRIDNDFIKKYLTDNLNRIYVLDSTGKSWVCPKKQIKKLIKDGKGENKK